MDKIIATLQAHGESYDSDCHYYSGCACGWNNGTEDHNEGFAEHVAEVLRPVLADTYKEAFAAGFDLCADDIGAWALIQDSPAEYNNPFEDTK